MSIDVPDFVPQYVEDQDTVRVRLDAYADPAINKREGGWYQTMTQPSVTEQARQWDSLNDVLRSASVLHALGIYLDYKAAEYNVFRKSATYASGSVTFTGTPGTIVPAGTAVIAATTSDLQATVRFITQADGTVGGGGTVSIAVQAEEAGSLWNVTSGAVSFLDATIGGITSVTNAAATTGGADIENDEELRQRVLARITAPQAAGAVGDYQRWALEEPGVGAVTVTPLYNGNINSVGVTLLDPTNNPVGQAVMDSLQRRLSGPIQIADPGSNPMTFDYINHNLLTANQSSIETNTTGLVGITNAGVARVTTVANDGAASLSITATGAGTMEAGTSTGTSGVPVTAGATYNAKVDVRSAVTARTVTPKIKWYTAAGAFISDTNGTAAADTTSGWTTLSISGVAPPTAAFATVSVSIASAASSEVHYIDKLMLRLGTGTTWVVGGTSGSGNIVTGTYYYKVTFLDNQYGETGNFVTAAPVTTYMNSQQVISNIPTGPVGTTRRRIYRSTSANGPFRRLSNGTINDNTTTTLTDNDSVATVAASTKMPMTNNTTQFQGIAPVGAWVFVDTPTTVDIAITAALSFENGYSLDGAGGTIATREAIKAALAAYIDSLVPGEDIVYKHVQSVFFDVAGVYDITSLTVQGGTANIPIAATEVANYTIPTLS